jgi:multicomponent Na+:H+ antiporter subunit D
VALVILIPLAGGMLIFLAGRKLGAWFGTGTAMATAASVLGLAMKLWREGPQSHRLGGWSAPLGIELYVDGLSMMMLLLTAVVGVFVSIYAAGFFRCPEETQVQAQVEQDYFWCLWLFLWTALNALFLSADIFNVYVVLELATLAAVALATISGGSEALRAGLRYLLAALTGSMAYLMGVTLLYGTFGALDFETVGRITEAGPAAALALALMSGGLLIKTALFPLHFWLPPAHGAAPAPVSAVLSGLVIKASFYLLLRLWFEILSPAATASAGQLIGVLGAAAILWGSFQALRQTRVKLLIAHSTVGQIGFLFLVFPLCISGNGTAVVPWFSEAWIAAIYQVLSHGLAKAAMFMAAGVVLEAAGNDRLSSMRDIAGRLPLVTFAFGLAGMSLIGLPPSGGFVAKWMLLKAIIASGQWWWLPVVAGGSLLTAGYVFLLLRDPFLPAEQNEPLRPVSRLTQLTALALAAAAVLVGFRVEEPIELLRLGRLFAEPVVQSGGMP